MAQYFGTKPTNPVKNVHQVTLANRKPAWDCLSLTKLFVVIAAVIHKIHFKLIDSLHKIFA